MAYYGYSAESDTSASDESVEEDSSTPTPDREQDECSAAIEAALSSIPEYTFASISTHESAPNPLVSIDGLGYDRSGRVGTPILLAVEDKQKLSPEGKWSAGIGNPLWSQWIQSKTADLGQRLGVLNAKANFTGMALTNNLGIIPPFSTASSDGNVFGVLVVIPPCFDCYDLRIVHPTSKEEIHYAADSPTKAANTVLAAFYTGAVPSLVPVASVGYPFVLLYCLTRPDAIPTSVPQDLTLFDSSVQRAQLENALKQWLVLPTSTDNGKAVPRYLTWMLDDYYEGPSKPTGMDARQTNFLLEVAQKLGLRVYMVEMEYTERGIPRGWEDPAEMEDDGYDNYDHYGGYYDRESPSPELDENENGDWIFDDVDETTLRLKQWQLPDGLTVDSRLHCVIDEENVLPWNWKEDLGPRTGEEYDKYSGTAKQVWKRTGVVIWESKDDNHMAVLTHLFGWRCAYFLNPKLWQEYPLECRIKFVEKWLELFSSDSVKSISIAQDPRELGAIRDMVLEFTITVGRPDLYLAATRVLGAPDSFDVLKQVAGRFSAQGKSLPLKELVEAALQKEHGILKRFNIVMSFYKKESLELPELLQKVMAGRHSYSQSLTADHMLRLRDWLGPELFQSHVLPQIGDYANASYWIDLLKKLQLDHKVTEIYLRHVIEQHRPKFTINGGSLSSAYSGSLYGYGSRFNGGYGNVKHDPTKSSNSVPKISLDKSTLSLLSDCFRAQALPLVDLLLSKILATPLGTTDKRASRRFFLDLLRDLKSYAQQHAIKISSHPPLQTICRRVVFDHLLRDLGARPTGTGTPSYVLPALSCNCNECRPISLFLLSEHQKNGSWRATKATRSHLYRNLENRQDIISKLKISSEQPTGRVGAIVLQKVVPHPAAILQEWQRAANEVAQCINALDDDIEWKGEALKVTGQGWTPNAAARYGGMDNPTRPQKRALAEADGNAGGAGGEAVAAQRKRYKPGDVKVIDLTDLEATEEEV